jgi:hypothetical protein
MKKLYLIAIIAGAVVVAQIVRYHLAQKRYEAEARALLDRANELATDENYKDAVAALDRIREKYPDSLAAAGTEFLRTRYAAKQEEREREEAERRSREELARKQEEEARKARRALIEDVSDPMGCCCGESSSHFYACSWTRTSICTAWGRVIADKSQCGR